jgi:hypothetical protein
MTAKEKMSYIANLWKEKKEETFEEAKEDAFSDDEPEPKSDPEPPKVEPSTYYRKKIIINNITYIISNNNY